MVVLRILVTGSSGQLGSYVCERLLDGHTVSGLDIRPNPYPGLKALSAKGSITKPADARRALKDIDAVVHCAAQVSVERSILDPLADADVNVIGTLNMLNEAAKADVGRFVYVSSAAVYGDPKHVPIDESHPTDPMSNYGASKLAGEKFTLAYRGTSALEVVAMRPFNFYSPRADPASPYSGVITKFVNRVRAGVPPVIEGDGLQTRDFIHAKDVAEMIVLLLTREHVSGQVFNCGSGRSTSIQALARTVISVSGRKFEPEHAPPRTGDIRHSLADTKKAREGLGFEPMIGLEEGLAELLS
jgi:UDP-glucose 4-epimerase